MFEFNFMKSLKSFSVNFELSFCYYGTPELHLSNSKFTRKSSLNLNISQIQTFSKTV